MTTYTKKVIEANKRYIRSLFGSDKNFYREVRNHRDIYISEHPRSRATAYNVIDFMVRQCLSEFPYAYYDMERHLARVIPDYNPARMRYKDGSLATDRVMNTYARLIARDGAKIIEKMDMERFLDGKQPIFWIS